jgi:hypothetical protein
MKSLALFAACAAAGAMGASVRHNSGAAANAHTIPQVAPELKQRVIEEDRAAYRADLIARVNKLKAESAATGAELGRKDAARILEEAAVTATVRKAERMRDSRDKGLLRDVTVQTQYGSVTGLGGASVNQFLGVPFASPPTGTNRWKAPQPLTPWGNLNATWFRNSCVQSEWYWGILSGIGEDCLNMNIWVPVAANQSQPSGGYPVMAFFFGGSYTYGGASFPLYDGITDVALAKDTILITVNYR